MGLGSRGALLGADPGAGDLTARAMLDRGLARLDSELLDRPETRGDLLHAIGMAYLGIGQLDGAERACGGRCGTAGRARAGPPGRGRHAPGARPGADALHRRRGRAGLRQALAIRRAQLGADHRTAESMFFLGLFLLTEDLGEPGESERLLEEALAIVRDEEGPESRGYGLALLIRGYSTVRGGDATGGLAAFATARGILNRAGPDPLIRLCDAASRPPPPRRCSASPVSALFHDRLEQLCVAKTERAARLSAEVLGADHALTGFLTKVYADALARVNRPDDAEAAYRRTLAICRRVYGDDHRFTGSTLLDLGPWSAIRTCTRPRPWLTRRGIMGHGRGNNVRLTHTLYVLGHIKNVLGSEDPSRIETGQAMSARRSSRPCISIIPARPTRSRSSGASCRSTATAAASTPTPPRSPNSSTPSRPTPTSTPWPAAIWPH